MCLCSWYPLVTRPQLQTYLPPTYLRELFTTDVNFHLKFTTLQRYTYPFLPQCADLNSEFFPSRPRIW